MSMSNFFELGFCQPGPKEQLLNIKWAFAFHGIVHRRQIGRPRSTNGRYDHSLITIEHDLDAADQIIQRGLFTQVDLIASDTTLPQP